MDVFTEYKKGDFDNLAQKAKKNRRKNSMLCAEIFRIFLSLLPPLDLFRYKSINCSLGRIKFGNGNLGLWKEVGRTSTFITGKGNETEHKNTDEEKDVIVVHDSVLGGGFHLKKGKEEEEKREKGEVFLRRKRDIPRRRRYQMADSPPHFRFTPIDQTVSPGSPVSLKCSSAGSPPPIISWTRDGDPLMPSHRIRLGSFRSQEGEVVSYVNISDATPRDGGLFRCTSHNAAGMATHASRLNVYGPPFVRPMMNSSVVAGEDATIWCPAGGFPTPTVTWQFLGQPLPRSLRHEILPNNTLVVREAKEMDKGQYTCLATGRGGQTAMADTYLRIINPPIIEEFNFAPNLKEGRRTQLTCMVTSGDLPITIQWLKNDHHLTHDADVEQKQISDYSMVLLFKRLRERHSGKYTCVAANTASSSNHTAELNVKVPPKWILSPSDLSVSVGRMIKLECMAKGVPEPVITWSKSSDEESRDFQRILEDGHRIRISKNGTLSILNVLKSDAATYLCQAANGVGSPQSKISVISVSARPEITSVGGRVTGHSGRSVKLECEAKGDSPMAVNWRRGHEIISEAQRISVRKFDASGESVRSVLSVNEIRPTDAGRYVCEAVNDHGHHTKLFNLVVLEPPSAPSDLKVEEVFSRSAKLSWMTSQPATITIQLKKGEESSWFKNGRNISVSSGESIFDLSSLSPFTKYYVRLFAANELGVSSPSDVIGFVTQEEAPSGSPRNIRVASLEPGALQISWNTPLPSNVNGVIRGYVIAIRKQNIREDFQYITRPTSHHGTKLRIEEYVVRNLSPNTLYEVSLKVFNRMGAGPLSSPRIVQGTMFEAPGCPPSGVSCKGDSLSGIRVWWETPPLSCANAPITGYSILATPTNKRATSQSSSFTKEVFTTNLEKNLGMMPPSSNISVVVRAYNDLGFSSPSRNIFCHTLDDAPSSPERLRVVSTEAGSFVAVWLPPSGKRGTILRYTMYYEFKDKVRHVLVPNNDVDSSWKKLSGFQPRERITVWVTALTSAGEGPPTPKVALTLMTSSSFGPFALSSQSLWKVSENSAVTLRCRGIGFPRPSISWLKDGRSLSDDRRHQILPGGDLHLIPQSSSNYTCRSTNSLGEDSMRHRVIVLSPPSKPILRVSEADRTSLNMSVGSHEDGGAPVLGYNLYQRYNTGEWNEKSVAVTSNLPTSFVLQDLPCGSDIHFYATAWNSQGISPSSEVLVASTRGSLPPRPQPSTLVEVNSTCATLRLYAWPENGCPVQHWKVEGKHENANEWKTIFSKVGRESRDIGFCDLQRTEAYLLKIIAYSEAGPTKVTYKVSLQDVYSGWATSEYVQEVMMGSETLMSSWMDAHIIAGIVSAILLTAAIVICSCVVFRKKYLDRERFTTTLKKNESSRLAHHGNSITDYHVYSPLPSKKMKSLMSSSNVKRKRSRPSLVSYGGPDEDVISTEDIYPYATFSAGSMDETLQYGISLHTHSPSSRDCFEGAQKRNEEIYSSRKDRGRSHYKESDVSYPPSKLLSNDRGVKSRPNSNVMENSEADTKEIDKLSETIPTQVNERNSREKKQRPVSRLQSVISPIPGVNRSNLNSPSHRDYSQTVPIQTLYAGHVKGNSGGNKDHISVTSGRHARSNSEGSASSPESCNSAASFVSARPLNPPSAFSDSRELSETECDREIALSHSQKFADKLKHELQNKFRHHKA